VNNNASSTSMATSDANIITGMRIPRSPHNMNRKRSPNTTGLHLAPIGPGPIRSHQGTHDPLRVTTTWSRKGTPSRTGITCSTHILASKTATRLTAGTVTSTIRNQRSSTAKWALGTSTMRGGSPVMRAQLISTVLMQRKTAPWGATGSAAGRMLRAATTSMVLMRTVTRMTVATQHQKAQCFVCGSHTGRHAACQTPRMSAKPFTTRKQRGHLVGGPEWGRLQGVRVEE